MPDGAGMMEFGAAASAAAAGAPRLSRLRARARGAASVAPGGETVPDLQRAAQRSSARRDAPLAPSFGAGWTAARRGGARIDSAWGAWSRSVDHPTIGACLLLFAMGVVLAFAASPALAEGNGVAPFYYAWRHLIVGAPAFAILTVCSFLNVASVRRLGVLLGLGGIAALGALLVLGRDHGQEATRWFSVMGVSVQPSELAKPGLVILSAWLLSGIAQKDKRVAAWCAGLSMVVLAGVVGLLVAQPDFGQTALLVATWGAMFFVAGGSIWVLVFMGGAAAAGGVAAYFTAPHFAARINAWRAGDGGGQHQLQLAAEAIANGGWFGRGLAQGVAKRSLPDAHSDFILAVAIEEHGFVAALAIIALVGFVAMRALWRLRDVKNAFVHIAGVGLAMIFGLQALVHVAVSAQLAPATGMTLPFVSYGGSSLIATAVTIGLLLALTRRSPKADG